MELKKHSCIDFEVHFECNAAHFCLTLHVIIPIWWEKTDAIYSNANTCGVIFIYTLDSFLGYPVYKSIGSV